jgi:rRNA maturation RNase YbeY
MKIEINNNQNLHQVSSRTIKVLANRIMDKARKIKPERTWDEISIVLTDNTAITDLNRKHLDKTDVTDVLSFCYPPIPGEDNQFTGELIINVQLAVTEGERRHGTTASRELALYIAHGCDHLQGETDYESSGRNRMRRRELRWLKSISEKDMALVENLLQA